jgi:polysaccharide pyruvyl transferase WcaK-like protein
MQVLVLGYYGRKNLGDDVFEEVFSRYLKTRNFIPVIKHIDEIISIPENIACIIVGGGDLINDQYIHKIKKLIENSPIYRQTKIPIYAIGVGIPYPSMIQTGSLDLFDYIVSRSVGDVALMAPKYGNRYSYAPDLSFLLDKFPSSNKNLLKQPTKKIGIFLSRTIYNSSSACSEESYISICDSLRNFFAVLLKKEKKVFKFRTGLSKIPEYELHLYPMCTEDRDEHDDRIINRDIYSKLKHFGNLHLHNDAIPIHEIGNLFSSFDFTICTRFHAHMFSIMAEVPFLSISTSSKVKNILEETETTNAHVKMEIHPEFHYPLSLNVFDCLHKFKYLEDHYSRLKSSLSESHQNYRIQMAEFCSKLDNLLFDLPIYYPNHINFLTFFKSTEIIKVLYSHYLEDNTYFYDDNEYREYKEHELIYQKGAILRYFSFLGKFKIVELISYIIVGNTESCYNYGLGEQIFSPEYILWDSISWIINNLSMNKVGIDIDINNKTPFEKRKIKVRHLNEDFKGYHRSGWNYVLSNLEKYHNENGIIFDSYLDRTFGWNAKSLSFANVIPYTSPWIGVFHHTNNPEYSSYDLSNAISNPYFIDSLPYCKGIIVLSKANKKYLMTQLEEFNIPILKLYHPTELEGFETFDLHLFENSPVKKIVQIGAWLRNTYAIYQVRVPDNYLKIALKGKNMDNYFLKDCTWEEIISYLKSVKNNNCENASGLTINRNSGIFQSSAFVNPHLSQSNLIEKGEDLQKCVKNLSDISNLPVTDNISGHPVKGNTRNKYLTGLINLIEAQRNSVTVLPELDNVCYDKILKDSIVFINLVDAAAVNTIIECIVRHTPILVNRLPATEEYLGKNYPLFYENIEDVYLLISDIRNIRNAHKYLKMMDKTRFTIQCFTSKLLNSPLYNNL